MTLSEILAAINALPAEEHAAAITALQNDGGAVVKAFRSKVFAAGKKEGGSAGSDAAAKLADAETRLAELEAELADVRAKAPDAAAITEAERKRWEPKLRKAEEEREAARTTLRTRERDLARAEFLSLLTESAEDGTRVDPEWARDVVDARWGSRLVPKDEGGVRVLQVDGDTEYDAPDTRTALRLLAADARKAVPARYVLANADTGAGVTNGAGAGGGGGYDPVAAGKALAGQQKADAGTNQLAFR